MTDKRAFVALKFRKKPVVIEAIQLTPELFWHFHDSKERVFDKFCFSYHCHPKSREIYKASIVIDTPEGKMRAELGDWIIKGVKGEFYPCKPDIFSATYEPAHPAPKADAAAVNPLCRANSKPDQCYYTSKCPGTKKCQAVFPKVVQTAPERIWLQVSDDEEHAVEEFPPTDEGVTWCRDSVLSCEVEYVRADLSAASPAPGAEKVNPKVWHDHYYQAFMRWLEDDSTHWISDKDAAWQAWMYLHEEGLTPIPDAAMSGGKGAG